ncbi:Protein IQ-DOMAIN 20 [Linum perenne]
MRMPRSWFSRIGRKLLSPSRRRRDVVILQSNAACDTMEMDVTSAPQHSHDSPASNTLDLAAIKIQATFRAHLAMRAFRALRSLVKVQALARGMYVRRQSQIALHCMRALVRLQVRVRARQLLGRCTDD